LYFNIHSILQKVVFSFEGIRTAKDNTKLNVLINWIEVSEQKYTYSRVLLTMVDVTQLRKTELELIKHQKNLEKLVAKRTNELETTVEELNSTNEELFDKNRIISEQMTELKNTMKHLKETQFKLIQSEKMASLGVLTAGIAHEINNPLNYIMGGYVGLKEFFTESKLQISEDTQFLLDSIKLGIDRASSIVKGLNQFSRDNDTFNEDCEINSIMDNCLVILQHQLKNRININKNYDSDTLNIKGNVGKLHQVFINILTNASQAIDDKGIINISTKIIKNKAVIEISDNGSGISKDNISKITDPFFTTKDPGKGTGLGLALTYKIIQEHKGELNFKSQINKGTTVKIILPLEKTLPTS